MKKTGLIVAAAVMANCVAAQAQTVRLGTEGAYPPYNFVNDNGEIDGFEREVGDEVCVRAKLDCTWVLNAWDSMIPNLISGNFDAIIAGMSVTDERLEAIDFTADYYPPDPSAYVGLSGSNPDVRSGVIAAQTSTIQAAFAAESGATVVEFSSPDETIAAVRQGEADAVLADYSFLLDIVNDSGGSLEFVGERVAIGGGVAFGVRKSDGELKQRLDDAIASMKADGALQALIAKWFDGKESY